jgi:DNA replication and repair protein RecF
MPNKALLNRAPVRPRDILGALRTVFFAPEDLAIVRGDPSERRTFIDELVTTRWPRMAGVRADYDRALKQKTALLKALSGRGMRSGGEGAEQTLSSWDEAMVTCGGELVAARLRTLADLAPLITETYDALAPIASAASAIYHSSNLKKGMESDVELVRQCLAEAMEARRGEELTRGICLVGPHRDDIILSLADLPVRGYASHGEGWSLALALRLASLDLLQADGVEPVLILDDVFAELDEHRRARVVEAMDRVEQTLISVAVRRDLPSNLQAHLFEVGLGVVCPLGEDSGDSSTILKEGMT